MRKVFALMIGLLCLYGNAQNQTSRVKKAPSGLSYHSPNVFTVGTQIAALLPTVSGGAVSQYTISPSLPSGLHFNSYSGKITGTPTAARAITTYNVTASNYVGSTTAAVVITVNSSVQAPLTLSYPSPNVYTTGSAIATLSPTTTGGAPTSYSVSPSLPGGLSISSSTGKITGTPTTASSLATYTVTASNSAGSKSFGVVITVNSSVQAPLTLSYPSPNVYTTGSAIATLSPTTTGGAPTSYSVSPSLPGGLSISSSTGKITGTPTTASSLATYTVTASNSAGSKSFGVVITVNAALQGVLSLSYNSPNVYTAGTAISTLSPTTTGGAVSSYSVSPALPSGLSLNTSTGNITGTPTAATSLATYTVTASNAAGSKTFGVVITVNAASGGSGTGTGSGPTATVNYTVSTAAFPNPERGFYHHTETHSNSYSALNQSTLTSYRTNSNITLVLRLFYLENFVNGSISSTYLTNMQSDFARIRAAGLKCIVRFAYADNSDSGVAHDANKATILSHIAQLTPILQANADIIALVQAGFIGSWGEWYYTDNFGMNPTQADYTNRKAVLDALLAVLPNRMTQLRTPALKQHTYNTNSPLSLTQAYTSASIARIGHHNDCFLASSDDYGTYVNTSTEYPYLEQETKYVPMGGETCALNAPRSQCASAISEMSKFHWSFMNMDYNENVIAGFQSDNCFTDMQNRLGYRFELVNGTFPTSATGGSAIPITIQMKNSGFATPFNERTPYIIFRNTVTNAEYKAELNSNPRFWNAGTTTTISDNVQLPTGMVAGSYKLFLVLPDADAGLSTRPEYSIRLANNNTWESTTGYNNLLHTITISNGSAKITASGKPEASMVLYPVPANNSVSVEMENIASYKVTVINSLGQTLPVNVDPESDNKIVIDTQNLSSGVYFVTFDRGDKKETRRIIVSH